MAKIDVLGRRRIPAAARERLGKFDRVTVYQVDGDPRKVDTVVLPDESWSETAEERAIAQLEKDKAQGTLRSFQI